MAVTRLVRKAKKNRTVSKKRINTIKRLTAVPVIKNVDIEQIKEEFAQKKTKPAAKKETVKEEVKETVTAEAKKVEAPVAEVKEEKPAKKATPKAKKAAPKAKEAAPKKAKKKEKDAE